MTDVVCGGCMSRQPAGTQYCGVCGREFPRTGRPVVAQEQGPQSAVQQQAGSYGSQGADIPYHQPSRIEEDFHTGTLVPVRPAAPAAAPEAVYAHVGKRIVAYLIDGAVSGLLFGIPYGIALAMAQPPAGETSVSATEAQAMVTTWMVGLGIGLVLMLAWSISMWVWEGKSGKTLGNLALGIRTVAARGLGPIGFGRAFLRPFLIGVSNIVPGVGPILMLLSPLFDNSGRKQGWHDKAANAVVVDATRKPAPEVAGFHPEARQVTSATGLPAPAPVQGQLAAASGTASPGALRAAGQAYSNAAAASGQYPAGSGQYPAASGQQPGEPAPYQQPAAQAPASFTPDGSAAAPDPWSFPRLGEPAAGAGLITDVPGSSPGGPAGGGAGTPGGPQPGQQPGQFPQSGQFPPVQPPAQQAGGVAPSAPNPFPPVSSAAPSPFPPTSSATPSPPATPNTPPPLTAANTIPEHPVLETSPYPPVSQPRQRESQPTRAVSFDELTPAQQAHQPYPAPPVQDQTPSGRHAAMPAGTPSGPDPDETRIEPASGATRMQAAVGSGAMDPPPVAGVVLALESGEQVRVDGPTLVGRNPSAPGSTGVNLVQIPDPMRSVSKNHAELGVDSAGLWLTDRGSTNGTVVSVPGLPPRVAEAGARVRVPVGSTIHFGDRKVVVRPGSGTTA
ncbi:RDD family protein [Myceligenerans crystallogenes]|uniref:FHA domain-containing protein n=1 Tax=Myceligenerans crystallogenes TaxID=316335 RepID=A0ABN2N312_9MICO